VRDHFLCLNGKWRVGGGRVIPKAKLLGSFFVMKEIQDWDVSFAT
jgi:hypothetical protein